MTIEQHISLKDYSTFHIGGTAEYFVHVETREEVREAVQWARAHGHIWRVIGEGSNILFGDGVVAGLTIHNGVEGMDCEKEQEGIVVRAGAGVLLDTVVAYACAQGWWGLENLSHIPGTVGATPIQNVGAYGVEIAQVVRSVSVYDSEADTFGTLLSHECAFGYRHSLFKEEWGKKYIVCDVSFFLPYTAGATVAYRDLAEYFKADTEPLSPERVRAAVIAIRSKKFPDWHVYGTAGSFFKNPMIPTEDFEKLRILYPDVPGYILPGEKVKVALGWILDHVCAMRGVREGAVGAYEAQALVLVNYGGATGEEVWSFAKKIISCVKEKTNIEIECEVTRIT